MENYDKGLRSPSFLEKNEVGFDVILGEWDELWDEFDFEVERIFIESYQQFFNETQAFEQS